MDKRCEIVQDLLFGYADGVLNQASKQLVEEHLQECKECQNQLEEIRKEGKKETEKIQKEIHYLKSLDRKAKIKGIKSFILVLLIVALIGAIAFYGNKFILIHNIAKIYEENQKADSYYTVRVKKGMNNNLMIIKEWYKQGKGKVKYETQTGEKRETIYEEYIDYVSGKGLALYPQNKTYEEKETQGEKDRKVGIYPFGKADSWQDQLKSTLFAKMRVEKSATRKAYVFYNETQEAWINAGTLLYEKQVYKEDITASVDSSVVMETYDSIQYIQLYVSNVEDSELEIPDLTEYKPQSSLFSS